MKTRMTYLLASMFAVLAVMIVLASLVRSEVPTPTSKLVGKFVQQSDTDFGYQMLRPADWESINLGDSRGYMPPGSTDNADRVLLTATNLLTLSKTLGQNTQIATLQQFRRDPSLSGWTAIREQDWNAFGAEVKLERSLDRAAIYVAKPATGQSHLIAYVVDDDQPLVLSLYGYGAYGDRATLAAEGLIDDFATIVASATALVGASPTPATSLDPSLGVRGKAPSTDISELWVERSYDTYAGDYHCHGDQCGYDHWTQLLTRWEGSADEVQRIYEAYWYRHSNLRGQWLFNA